MIACLFVCDKEQIVLTCERDSRRELGNFHPGAKTKKKKRKKNTPVRKLCISTGYCWSMLLVREKTPQGILADKLIRWQDYLSWLFFRLIQVKSKVEDAFKMVILITK